MTCCTIDLASRRAFFAAAAGAIASACAGPTADGAAKRQADLQRQAAAALGPIVDPHAHPGSFATRGGDVSASTLDEMRAARVHCAFFAAIGDVSVIRREAGGIRQSREPQRGELWAGTQAQLARVRARMTDGRPRLVLGRADVAGLMTGTQPTALLAVEGGDPLEGRVDRVAALHAMGVRAIQPMHYRVNELGDIQTEPPRHRRLTDVGAAVVREMNRLGMIVDGAHAARETLRDMVDASRTPIVVSHTGPWALRRIQRHLTDDELRHVASKGGVIAVWPLASPPAPLDQFLADLRYVVRVAGIDHTGIGTDMTGLDKYTAIPTYADFAAVPAALLASGVSETDARKLLGGNVARVMEQSLSV